MRTLHGHEDGGGDGRGSGAEGLRRLRLGSLLTRRWADGGFWVPSLCVKESKGFRAPGFAIRRLPAPGSRERGNPDSWFCGRPETVGFRLLGLPRPPRWSRPQAWPRPHASRWAGPWRSSTAGRLLNVLQGCEVTFRTLPALGPEQRILGTPTSVGTHPGQTGRDRFVYRSEVEKCGRKERGK